MLNFQCPPKPAHPYFAFLSKIRNIPELQERYFLKKINRLPWEDPYNTYEALRDECHTLLEETRLEKQSKQVDLLYESDLGSTALAATPRREEAASLLLPPRRKAVP